MTASRHTGIEWVDDDDNSDFTSHKSLSIGSTTGLSDLDDTLRSSLDGALVPYYDLMVSGDMEKVPMHYRKLVQKQVRIIIEEGQE